MDTTPTGRAEHGMKPVHGGILLQQTLSDDKAVPIPQGPRRCPTSEDAGASEWGLRGTPYSSFAGKGVDPILLA